MVRVSLSMVLSVACCSFWIMAVNTSASFGLLMWSTYLMVRSRTPLSTLLRVLNQTRRRRANVLILKSSVMEREEFWFGFRGA